MPAVSIFEMSNAVRELSLLEKKRLVELDELTIRQQGNLVEGGLAGLRVLVARTASAAELLASLAPYEAQLATWLDAKRITRIDETPFDPAEPG